jgi:hypothetical protein
MTDIKKRILNNPDDLSIWDELYILEKEKWSTKFINTLPDDAFALILPGGELDEEGMTVPRTLRKLPHHTKDVESPTEDDTVDMPHLRNALSRVSQIKGATELQLDSAERHLRSHFERIKAEEEN